MISITDFVSRLNRATGGPVQWTACCPAHEDKSPSLSVRDAGDKILFHCFAGCSGEDILGALKLEWRDVHVGDRWEVAKRGAAGAAHLRVPEQESLDRSVLALAASAMRNGETLNAEDTARVYLARRRMQEIHHAV